MKAEVNSSVLKFDEPFPWIPRHQCIYIRSAYEDILAILQQSEESYLIVGNPGTGKSFFAIYVLYHALRASKTVVFHRSPDKILYLFKPGQKAKMCVEGVFVIEELNSSETWYLYDAGTRRNALQATLQSRLIVFSSPSKDNLSEVYKFQLPILHMPIWTLKELLTASELDQYKAKISKVEIEDLFETFGGIPRYVLVVEKSQRSVYLRELKSHISRCTLDDIRKVGQADIDEFTRMIFHRHSESDSGYLEYEVKFASQYIGDKVVKTISEKQYDEMKALAVQGSDIPSVAASLRGWILERIVHDILPNGGTFRVRKLSDNKEEERKFPQMNCKVFSTLEEVGIASLPSSQYLRPKSKTFEAADALCPPNSVFQVTVSKSHPVKANGLKKILNEFQKHKNWTHDTRVNFYFVVPPDVYKYYTREQTYNTAKGTKVVDSNLRQFKNVDQYVLNFEFSQ
jgi:hypothetical protein